MYNISYVFTLPDGEEISGYTKKIGDGVYLKADGNGRLAVKYFKAIPFLNSPAEDAQNPISQGVRIGIGALLVFLMPIRYNYDKGEARMESGFSGIRV